MTLVTETMGSEVVRDRDGNLLYVEYLITTWDREPGKDDVWIMSEQIQVRPSDIPGTTAENYVKQREGQQRTKAEDATAKRRYRTEVFD